MYKYCALVTQAPGRFFLKSKKQNRKTTFHVFHFPQKYGSRILSPQIILTKCPPHLIRLNLKGFTIQTTTTNRATHLHDPFSWEWDIKWGLHIGCEARAYQLIEQLTDWTELIGFQWICVSVCPWKEKMQRESSGFAKPKNPHAHVSKEAVSLTFGLVVAVPWSQTICSVTEM